MNFRRHVAYLVKTIQNLYSKTFNLYSSIFINDCSTDDDVSANVGEMSAYSVNKPLHYSR